MVAIDIFQHRSFNKSSVPQALQSYKVEKCVSRQVWYESNCNNFKYRNWISACLYPFEEEKWGSARWKMSSLCNRLHWHSQETNWRILHFKTARPAPFNAKGDLCSTHSDVEVVQASRGHTYFVAAHASCHAQHVLSNCESLMHACVCVSSCVGKGENRKYKER